MRVTRSERISVVGDGCVEIQTAKHGHVTKWFSFTRSQTCWATPKMGFDSYYILRWLSMSCFTFFDNFRIKVCCQHPLFVVFIRYLCSINILQLQYSCRAKSSTSVHSLLMRSWCAVLQLHNLSVGSPILQLQIMPCVTSLSQTTLSRRWCRVGFIRSLGSTKPSLPIRQTYMTTNWLFQTLAA